MNATARPAGPTPLHTKLLIAAVGLAAALGLVAAVLPAPAVAVADIPFDSALWLNPPTRTTRLAMLNDLVRNERLIGRTESDVRALLGEPQNRVEVRDAAGHRTLWYAPGARREGRRLSTFLEVSLDGGTGRVRAAKETLD